MYCTANALFSVSSVRHLSHFFVSVWRSVPCCYHNGLLDSRPFWYMFQGLHKSPLLSRPTERALTPRDVCALYQRTILVCVTAFTSPLRAFRVNGLTPFLLRLGHFQLRISSFYIYACRSSVTDSTLLWFLLFMCCFSCEVTTYLLRFLLLKWRFPWLWCFHYEAVAFFVMTLLQFSCHYYV